MFPLWWSGRKGPVAHRVLFPLYWHFTNEKQDTTTNLLGPFFWARQGTSVTHGILPVAWYSRDTARQTGLEKFLLEPHMVHPILAQEPVLRGPRLYRSCQS